MGAAPAGQGARPVRLLVGQVRDQPAQPVMAREDHGTQNLRIDGHNGSFAGAGAAGP